MGNHKGMRVFALISMAIAATLVASCAGAAPPTPAPTKAPEVSAPAATKVPEKPAVAATAAPTSAPKPVATEKKPDSLTPVRVGHLGITSDAGIYIAFEKGYFKELGLDVQLERVGNSVDVIPMLASDKLDTGGGSVNASLYNAINRDIPIKAVADKGSAFPAAGGLKPRNGQMLVVRKDLVDSGKLRSSADFRGMTIAVPQTASAVYIELVKELEKGGLKESDVKITAMAIPDMVAALTNKAVDAAFMVEPNANLVIENGVGSLWKLGSDIYPYHTTGIVLYSPTFISQHPDAAKKYMIGYIKGVRDFNEAMLRNKDKANIVQILVKYTGLKDPTIFDRTVPSGLNNDGYLYLPGMIDDQDWYAANNLIKQKQDMKDIVDNSFVDNALSVLGKAGWGTMP